LEGTGLDRAWGVAANGKKAVRATTKDNRTFTIAKDARFGRRVK